MMLSEASRVRCDECYELADLTIQFGSGNETVYCCLVCLGRAVGLAKRRLAKQHKGVKMKNETTNSADSAKPNSVELAVGPHLLSVAEKISLGHYDPVLLRPNRPIIKAAETHYRALMTSYRSEVARLKTEFKDDLLWEHGAVGNPKADKCFDLAWEYGHSAGFSEIQGFFGELVELIK
jgi:hypothetical protein